MVLTLFLEVIFKSCQVQKASQYYKNSAATSTRVQSSFSAFIPERLCSTSGPSCISVDASLTCTPSPPSQHVLSSVLLNILLWATAYPAGTGGISSPVPPIAAGTSSIYYWLSWLSALTFLVSKFQSVGILCFCSVWPFHSCQHPLRCDMPLWLPSGSGTTHFLALLPPGLPVTTLQAAVLSDECFSSPHPVICQPQLEIDRMAEDSPTSAPFICTFLSHRTAKVLSYHAAAQIIEIARCSLLRVQNLGPDSHLTTFWLFSSEFGTPPNSSENILSYTRGST